MRANVFAWLAAAALALTCDAFAGATTTTRAHDSHSTGTSAPRARTVTETCDPSKWKPPADGMYATNGKVDPHKLNVHLIAHSHDDPYVCMTHFVYIDCCCMCVTFG